MFTVIQTTTIEDRPSWTVLDAHGERRGNAHPTLDAAIGAAAFLIHVEGIMAPPAPMPAPARVSAPSPIPAPDHRQRAAEGVDLRCQACGQGMRIQLTDVYNKLPLTCCPICGTATLERGQAKPVITDEKRRYFRVDAKCFDKINPELVALLYQNWRFRETDEDPTLELPMRFVDYLKEQLEA